MGLMISSFTSLWRSGLVVLPCIMAGHAPRCCGPGSAGASDHLRGSSTAVVPEIPGCSDSCWAVLGSSGSSKSWGKDGKPWSLELLRSFGTGWGFNLEQSRMARFDIAEGMAMYH